MKKAGASEALWFCSVVLCLLEGDKVLCFTSDVLQVAPLSRNCTWNFLGVITAKDDCHVPDSEDSLFFLSVIIAVTGFKSRYLHRTFCFRVRSPRPRRSIYLSRHIQIKTKLSLYRPFGLKEVETPRISRQFAQEGVKVASPSVACTPRRYFC